MLEKTRAAANFNHGHGRVSGRRPYAVAA